MTTFEVMPEPCLFGWPGCTENYTGGHYCEKPEHGGGHRCVCGATNRTRIVHLASGERRKDGPVIKLTGDRDWTAGTACGRRVPTIRATRLRTVVTCPTCLESVEVDNQSSNPPCS